VAYTMLHFSHPTGSQEAMCAHPSPDASTLFLKKNFYRIGLTRVCFPFAFLKVPFMEKKKKGWWRSSGEIQPKMCGREQF
jgi:hypothetical protein